MRLMRKTAQAEEDGEGAATMPAMDDPRIEQFCLLKAQGARHMHAAAEAGFNQPHQRGSELMKREPVRARIAELTALIDREKAASVVQVAVPTRDFVLRELMQNVMASKAARDRSSVNKGLELIGKELGMFVQRSMVVESPLANVPADALIALLRALEPDGQGGVQVAAAPAEAPALPPVLELQAEEDW